MRGILWNASAWRSSELGRPAWRSATSSRAPGIDHVVLEQGRIGDTWRHRWESFCLVTPNWSVRLPGFPYDGDDPDGFMKRDEIVAYLERYARSFGAPVRTGVDVERVLQGPGGGFVVETTSGALHADALVVATGAYQRAHRIPGAEALPAGLPLVGIGDYRDPGSLPTGAVLVVGSGQSGAQIAEELRAAGRRVYLSCGRAPWAPRRWGGHDIVWWLAESGFMDQPTEALPAPEARFISNPLASGHDGGHDLDLRALRATGVTLTGRFLGVEGREAAVRAGPRGERGVGRRPVSRAHGALPEDGGGARAGPACRGGTRTVRPRGADSTRPLHCGRRPHHRRLSA